MAPLVDLLEPLQRPAFVLLGAPVSWSEVLGDVTGAACVWLVARQHLWNWPIGIANNAFFFLLFFSSKLYGDASLQVIFAVLGAYGWWTWVRGGDEARGGGALPVRRTTKPEWLALAALGVIATVGLSLWLRSHTDSPVPVADATVTVVSLAATWGQAKKLIESWWLWIAVDVISVPLYVNRHLYPTALLYVVFGVLCVAGLRSWSAALRGQPTLAARSSES